MMFNDNGGFCTKVVHSQVSGLKEDLSLALIELESVQQDNRDLSTEMAK